MCFFFSPALLCYFLIESSYPFSSDSVTPHKAKCLIDLVVYNNETGIRNLEIFLESLFVCVLVFHLQLLNPQAIMAFPLNFRVLAPNASG